MYKIASHGWSLIENDGNIKKTLTKVPFPYLASVTKACNSFLCPLHSKNGGGALSVTPVRVFVRSSVRPFVRPLSKFGVRSITCERLHRFDSNLVCLYKTLKHRSSSIWVTTHWFMGLLKKHSTKIGVRSITFERLHRFDSYLACWCIISKHRSSSIWVTAHWFLTELWAFNKNIAQKLVSAQ